MPGYSVDVIDIGLRLEDALAMGKRPETFTRKSRLDEKTEAALTDLEREYFVGRERKDADGKPYWIASRVELNDLSSPQLVAYVEGKLEEHDALGKVIPPPGALKERSERMFRDALGGWVDEIIAEMLGTDELKESMAEEFEERFKLQGAEAWIESGFEYRDDTQSWRDAVKRVLRDAYVGKHKDAIRGRRARVHPEDRRRRGRRRRRVNTLGSRSRRGGCSHFRSEDAAREDGDVDSAGNSRDRRGPQASEPGEQGARRPGAREGGAHGADGAGDREGAAARPAGVGRGRDIHRSACKGDSANFAFTEI